MLIACGALLCVAVQASPKSRFNRDIDDKKLEEVRLLRFQRRFMEVDTCTVLFQSQEWADPESDEWHEDTFEWKRKMAQKRAVRCIM
jgi:hypothetical protein